MIVPSDEAANDVALAFRYFYMLTIIKELNLDCHVSILDDNGTYTFINNKTKDQIIKEHKLYLSKHKINLANNMQDLPVKNPKMHKNPISFCLIIAFPTSSIKPLLKDIT